MGPTARARRKARIIATLAAAAVIVIFAAAYVGGIYKPVDYTWQALAFTTRHVMGADPPIQVDHNTGSSPWLNKCGKAGSASSAQSAPSVHNAADAAQLIAVCQNPLLLVSWDQNSVQNYPPGWTRSLTARLIDRLSADGARLIVIDRLYEDDDPNNPPAGTAELASAMRRAGNVVIAQEVTNLSEGYIASGLHLVPLDPSIASAARAIGLANLPPPDSSDPQHFNRSYDNEVVWDVRAPPIPSLALAAAKVLGIGPASSDPTFLINFAGQAGNTFQTDSLVDVLNIGPLGSSVHIDPSEIAGRIVFLGDEYFLDHDTFLTPVDTVGPMYGIELNMHAFNTILHHDPLNVPSTPLQLLIGFPFACLAAAWASRAGLLSTAAVTLALLAALLGSTLVLFVRFGVWIDSGAPISALIVAPLVIMGVRLGAEQRARREIRSIFGRYVAPRVVTRICDDPDSFELEGALREITVLFSDIRGFTTLSEGMSPQQIVRILNLYFTAMVEEIHAQGGTVDKYVGDAIMALFGAPDDLPDSSACAVRAALGMQKRLAILNQQFGREFGTTLAAGIGLHHGMAAVGIMGCPAKREYSAIGDTVNTASRLESFTKDAGYGITASVDVVNALPADLLLEVKPQDLGDVALKGRSATVRVYGLGEPLAPHH